MKKFKLAKKLCFVLALVLLFTAVPIPAGGLFGVQTVQAKKKSMATDDPYIPKGSNILYLFLLPVLEDNETLKYFIDDEEVVPIDSGLDGDNNYDVDIDISGYKWKKHSIRVEAEGFEPYTASVSFGVKPVVVKINKTKATLNKGDTLKLKVTGTTQKVTWSSDKKSVAAVSAKGKVTAKKAGRATITATVGKKTYKCIVIVFDPATLKDFVINEYGTLTKYTGKGGDIIIPGTVRTIGKSAFENKSSLTSVIIPESVASINSFAFMGCSNLTSVFMSEGVQELYYDAFSDCSKLKNITIPKSLTNIRTGAFDGTPWLKEKLNERADHFVIINNILYDGKNAKGKVVIPDGVIIIGEQAFRECTALTDITIPDTVTTIMVNAFSKCKGLKSVVIPEGVTAIERYSFTDCSELTSVTIPETVTLIENNAFFNCPKLIVKVPKSLKGKFDSKAFAGCKQVVYY